MKKLYNGYFYLVYFEVKISILIGTQSELNMKTTSKQEIIKGDRIKLPYQFDVAKMTAEMQAIRKKGFEYYDAIPLRAPAHEVDSSVPFPPPADDYADGSWTQWMDTSYLKECPYIANLIKYFAAHTTVNLVRLLRLAPGAVVSEHTDPTLGIHIERSMIRLTIPILVNDQVQFYLNNTLVPMRPGECWYLNLTDPHRVINGGIEERINLTIDVIPNEWIIEMIKDAETN